MHAEVDQCAKVISSMASPTIYAMQILCSLTVKTTISKEMNNYNDLKFA